MSQFSVQLLLKTDTATIQDVVCRGDRGHKSAEECALGTHLVFPYRGVYVRHLGRDDAVAEANPGLFFNDAEGYSVSHPLDGGEVGPYRFSRNPIYLAFSLFQTGIALGVADSWTLITLLPAISVMSLVVIPREERYLEAHFGEEYASYKARVRRWL